MTYVVTRKPLKLADGRVLKHGDYLTDADIAEIPAKIRERRIQALVSLGRLSPLTADMPAGPLALEESRLVYVPVGCYRLPNGEVVRGKETARRRLQEITQ